MYILCVTKHAHADYCITLTSIIFFESTNNIYITLKPRETYEYNKPTSHELKTDINRPYYFSDKSLITFNNRSNEVTFRLSTLRSSTKKISNLTTSS